MNSLDFVLLLIGYVLIGFFVSLICTSLFRDKLSIYNLDSAHLFTLWPLMLIPLASYIIKTIISFFIGVIKFSIYLFIDK